MQTIDSLKALVPLEQLIAESLESNPIRYPGGNEYLFLCPYHADTRPSLQVNPVKRRFFCHPCGISGDAIDWLRRFYQCSWSEALLRLRVRSKHNDTRYRVREIPRPARSHNGHHVSASQGMWKPFWYTDEVGNPKYVVIRTPDKQFLLKRYRPFTGRGQWLWGGGKKLRRYLYGLFVITEARVPACFLVEGEGLVDKLAALHLPAVSAMGGASADWPDGYSSQLKHAGVRRVVLLPDEDDVGMAFMRRAKESLRRHKIRTHTERLYGLDTGEDVVDYLDNGGSVSYLRQLLK